MKTHADTETALVVEMTDDRTMHGLEKERRKNAHLAEFERLINRHIMPHFTGQYRTYEIHKREHVCSGCGSAWTEKSETYNGGCCAVDEKNNPEAAEQAASQPATSGVAS
jgi:hypothetical protein